MLHAVMQAVGAVPEGVIVAFLGAVPSTIAALAAYRTARSTNRKTDEIVEQVTPSNGTPTARIVEELGEALSKLANESRTDREQIKVDLRSLKDDVQYHVTVQHGRGPLGE